MFECSQCPRKCSALRGVEGRGFCGMGSEAVVARMALHFDEEPCISGETPPSRDAGHLPLQGRRGSGAVFFSGCPLKCVFCQNEPISHGGFGRRVTNEQLKDGFRDLVRQGANNINLVNPTHFSHLLPDVLDGSYGVPIVYNCGGYELTDTLRTLNGLIDVYLPDLKYVSSALSKRYSGAEDYFDFASKALLEMLRQVGDVELDRNGIIKKGLIVRHLILPGGVEDSFKVIDWIAANLPGAWVSLMAQYMPFAKAGAYPEINRQITQKEYDAVYEHMLARGLEDGYVQQLGASDEKYIPPFDLTGVPGPG